MTATQPKGQTKAAKQPQRDTNTAIRLTLIKGTADLHLVLGVRALLVEALAHRLDGSALAGIGWALYTGAVC